MAIGETIMKMSTQQNSEKDYKKSLSQSEIEYLLKDHKKFMVNAQNERREVEMKIYGEDDVPARMKVLTPITSVNKEDVLESGRNSVKISESGMQDSTMTLAILSSQK